MVLAVNDITYYLSAVLVLLLRRSLLLLLAARRQLLLRRKLGFAGDGRLGGGEFDDSLKFS